MYFFQIRLQINLSRHWHCTFKWNTFAFLICVIFMISLFSKKADTTTTPNNQNNYEVYFFKEIVFQQKNFLVHLERKVHYIVHTIIYNFFAEYCSQNSLEFLTYYYVGICHGYFSLFHSISPIMSIHKSMHATQKVLNSEIFVIC